MPNYSCTISLTHTSMNSMKNMCKNNILQEGRGFCIRFFRGKRHETPDSAPLIECEPSKISYIFWGASMIKYTARENLYCGGRLPSGGSFYRFRSPYLVKKEMEFSEELRSDG